MAQNKRGDLMVAQGLPPYVEMARRGDLFTVQTATPFAPITALPTTTAKLEIKNNHASKHIIVDRIWTWQLLGTAVVWQSTPWAQVGNAVVSAVTALVVYKSNSVEPYTSVLGSDAVTAIDQSVIANGWTVFGGSTTSWGLAAATPGGATVGNVEGRLIVPPGKALHVTVTGSVATASSTHCGASWWLSDITNNN